MIKIRYRGPNELSPGLHAEAERHGRCTTIYLLSGLTAQERRAALRRLRLSARMGYCPPLPAAQLTLALLADRVRTGAWRDGAVFRLHPAGSTLPVMVVSAGAIAFLLLRPCRSRSCGPVAVASRRLAAPVASASAGAGRHGTGGPGDWARPGRLVAAGDWPPAGPPAPAAAGRPGHRRRRRPAAGGGGTTRRHDRRRTGGSRPAAATAGGGTTGGQARPRRLRAPRRLHLDPGRGAVDLGRRGAAAHSHRQLDQRRVRGRRPAGRLPETVKTKYPEARTGSRELRV